MSFLFGSSKPPAIQPIPPTPTIDEAARERDRADAYRRRKGRAATIFGGNKGSDMPSGASKVLLGG